MRVFYVPLASLLVFVCWGSATHAQESDDAIAAASRWPLEEITLDDGSVRRGLIESETQGELTFVDVRRRKGKPLYLLVYPIDVSEIQQRKRLAPAQRQELIQRIRPLLVHRSHARIEAGEMRQLKLQKETALGRSGVRFDGPWFSLSSTADDEITRRCIVRVGQVFLAYRRILPPTIRPERPLRILLLGSEREYQDYLRRRKLQLRNPALYIAGENLIVAGSDLSIYGQRLAQASARNRQVRAEAIAMREQLAAEMTNLARRLKAEGVSDQEIRRQRTATERRWSDDLRRLETTIAGYERENTSAFNEMTAAMFKRLYHEAFHAYVENYVLRGGKPDERRMPRWLNEGLAQVFEGGRLEVDTLRIDQPDADKLRRLQADLRGSRPLGIAEIVDADPSLFLVSHSRDRRVSQRHYLYCWALTHYLIFGPERLSPSGVIEMADETKTPQKRLESLVGMPIEQFQRRWRDAMLAMRPAN